VSFRLEADFTGTGAWAPVLTLTVSPGEVIDHALPEAFGAYWLRLVPDSDTTATALFTYD
jgi:hypothetical protein